MSIFTEMMVGERSSVIVAEDTRHVCFVAEQPNAFGHVICVPRIEYEDLFAMPNDAYQALLQFAQTIAQALVKVIPCEKVGMASISLAVRHVHLHLVPLHSGEDMNFTQQHPALSCEEMNATAELLQSVL